MEMELKTAEEISEMIKEKKFSELKRYLVETNPADVAEVLNELPKEQYMVLYRLLPKELAAEVFVDLDSDLQERLISAFSDMELKEVLDELYLDDTVDIIEEMPASVVRRILANSTPYSRKRINTLLMYPKDSAGSLMTPEYIGLKKDWTVDQAFELIRRVAIDKETIYTCYVTDSKRVLIGLVTAKMLLLADRNQLISEIMEENVIAVSTTEDQEVVAQMIDKYDFLALPVVDAENRLVGIITVDDVIDVMHEEVEEDIAKMNAIAVSEKPYLKTTVFELWKNRIPWLLLLMVSATFTGMIISGFEDALAVQAALTAFIPMLMGTGGNSGSQSSVTIIRALSQGEIEFKDIFRVVWKEIRVAVLCGVSLAIGTFVKILLIDNLLLGSAISLPVAAVVCVTLCVTVFCAKFIGCTLPMLAEKIGLDPAVMASPFITTIVDAVSLVVYFQVAGMLLGL
ncbi:MAG: magnesium transporter [Lachnospiraceae bacterium]|nr:magnesium transporter [Lachnospiraceae bacterium]